MDNHVPESGPAFEAMMLNVDATLIRDGVAITARPLRAVGIIAERYRISIPLGDPTPGMPPELRRYAPLSRRINDWYNAAYGDRLKIDFAVGRSVVELDGDLYMLRFPLMFGEVRFVLSREFIDAPSISTRGPATSNIVQLVDGLMPARAAALSDAALRSLDAVFAVGMRAHYTLQANDDQELIHIARGDIATAVANLMDPGKRYGESKWASLQAAEKVIKAVIARHGGAYKYTHGLGGLSKQLAGLGVEFDAQPLTAAIQCKPGIRYGEESCTRGDALLAHQASLQLVAELVEAGAKLDTGLG